MTRRTTALGLLTDAEQMHVAAMILRASGEFMVQMPTYYLLGHSLELAMKSFLLADGTTLDRLKYKVGHDLIKPAQRVIDARSNPLSERSPKRATTSLCSTRTMSPRNSSTT